MDYGNTVWKTWWGEHWLRSLENIDCNNRLPRGATYARQGHVLSVKIKENEMQARVQGSRATPYRVTIIAPPFFEEICNHPALFLKNGNDDPALSGKVQLLLELLDSITAAGEKVLIFTQFTEMGAMLERIIADHLGDRRKLDRQAEQQGAERDFHPVSNYLQSGNTWCIGYYNCNVPP